MKQKTYNQINRYPTRQKMFSNAFLIVAILLTWVLFTKKILKRLLSVDSFLNTLNLIFLRPFLDPIRLLMLSNEIDLMTVDPLKKLLMQVSNFHHRLPK